MRLWSEHAVLRPLRCGRALGAWCVLPLEGLKEALQAQVVVPCLCEGFVSPVWVDQVDTRSTAEGERSE